MLRNYLKVALKVFWRHKYFTVVNLLGICATLVAAIIATMALDMEIGEVTGNDPPEIHNDRTLHLSMMVLGDRTGHGHGFSYGWRPAYAFLDRYVRTLETAESVTIFSRPQTWGLHGGAEEAGVEVRLTDGAFWEVFSFEFIQGRPYTAAEVEAGALVAVISDRFARRFFGSSEAVGESVPLDGRPHRVAGVVDPGYSRRASAWTDVWVPVTSTPAEEWRPYRLKDRRGFSAAVLAPRTVDRERVRAEFATVMPRVEPVEDDSLLFAPLATAFEEWVISDNMRQIAEAGHEWRSAIAGLVVRTVLIGGGVVLVLLLLPVLHLVNINISRIEERAAEIGVRRAFGGSSRTLVGQFIAENVLLTLVGGLLSLPLSLGLWMYFAPGTLDILLMLRAFAYGTLCAALFGALSGAYPSWKMARLHPVQALTGRRT